MNLRQMPPNKYLPSVERPATIHHIVARPLRAFATVLKQGDTLCGLITTAISDQSE